MFDASLRRAKDRLYRPLAARLGFLHPALFTLLALLAGLAAAWLAARGSIIPSLAMWLLNRLLDGLDGLVARAQNKESDFGGYLDILLDFIVYAAIPIGLVLDYPNPQHYLALVLMLSAFYVNAASWMYLAAILEKRAAHNRALQTAIIMPAGLVGGFETIVAYCIFLLLPNAIAPLFIGFAILVFVTTLQRLVWAWRNIR
jgi:phosphatidylglycerophosphate synthase